MAAIIEDQQTNGLTILDYYQQQQLSISSFYAVRKKSVCRQAILFAQK